MCMLSNFVENHVLSASETVKVCVFKQLYRNGLIYWSDLVNISDSQLPNKSRRGVNKYINVLRYPLATISYLVFFEARIPVPT